MANASNAVCAEDLRTDLRVGPGPPGRTSASERYVIAGVLFLPGMRMSSPAW